MLHSEYDRTLSVENKILLAVILKGLGVEMN
jgi:hypothetical protein